MMKSACASYIYGESAMASLRLLTRLTLSAALLGALLSLSGCGINNIPRLDQQVKASWAEVQNEYQRRADLVPNLVATVKGVSGCTVTRTGSAIERCSRCPAGNRPERIEMKMILSMPRTISSTVNVMRLIQV